MNVKYYKTAGITVEVRSDFPISENSFHEKFRKFEVSGPGEDNVIIRHHLHLPDFPSENIPGGVELYNKNQWRIYRADGKWIYQFRPIMPTDPAHSATGIFNEDYTTLSVYTNDFTPSAYQNARFPALTLFNNDQIMFAPLLCNRNGVILHSNGFDINGNGILLAGISGVGKSTLSRMLKRNGFKILCDDRMFLTRDTFDFWIHGNWCHGTVPDTATGYAPLKAILFLEQSSINTIEQIQDRKSVVHSLLHALVQPFLVPSGWEKTFDIIKEIVKRVDCYRVKFDLSGDICRNINDLFGQKE